ncbi:MAG: aminotransferase class V-fold PLP-dependent enzyme [Chlamydiota bacterium]
MTATSDKLGLGPMNLASIRQRYPALKQGTFLNHAATAPISYATTQKMRALCSDMQQPLENHFEPWFALIEETRQLLAELLHCSSGEIALTSSTSVALSIIAGSIDFEVGDRVLVPRNEFPSNRYVWQNLHHRGVECLFFDLPNGASLIETLEQQNLNKVRLIALSLVSYSTGQKQDIEAFGAFCREHGIFSCVDAIQGVGTFPIDVQKAAVDFLAGGAQKWLLGPVGCGYFYIRKELIERVRVPLVGWASVRCPENFDELTLDFASEARRFEAGFPNIVSIGGLNASLWELKKIGWDMIYARIRSHTNYLAKNLDPIVADPSHLGAIVIFPLPAKADLQEVRTQFINRGIALTIRNHCVRVAPHFYNTQQELDYFLNSNPSCVA